jgi:hypothetical protein
MGVISRQLCVLVLMRGGVMPQISGPFRVAFCLLEFISRSSDLKPLANLITWCNLIWTASEAGGRRLQVLPILERLRRSVAPVPFFGGCVSGHIWALFPIHFWRTVRTAWPACWRPKDCNERISFTDPIVGSFVKGWIFKCWYLPSSFRHPPRILVGRSSVTAVWLQFSPFGWDPSLDPKEENLIGPPIDAILGCIFCKAQWGRFFVRGKFGSAVRTGCGVRRCSCFNQPPSNSRELISCDCCAGSLKTELSFCMALLPRVGVWCYAIKDWVGSGSGPLNNFPVKSWNLFVPKIVVVWRIIIIYYYYNFF